MQKLSIFRIKKTEKKYAKKMIIIKDKYVENKYLKVSINNMYNLNIKNFFLNYNKKIRVPSIESYILLLQSLKFE